MNSPPEDVGPWGVLCGQWGVSFMRCLRVGMLMEGCRGMPVFCWGFHSRYLRVEGSQNLFGEVSPDQSTLEMLLCGWSSRGLRISLSSLSLKA